MYFKNKVALVTGGAGFIGSHLSDRLLEEGAEKVIILDNFVSGFKGNISHLLNDKRVELIEGDVRDFKLVKKLVKGSDYVFNLAASKMAFCMENPRMDLETNIVGPFNVMQAAADANVRVVHASTGSVLGSSDKPMDEDHVKNPKNPYGISKLAGEKYVLYYAKEHGIKASVIRYFHVFGPRQDYSGKVGVIGIFLSRIMKGLPPIVNGNGSQIRCFTYISDDVDATLLLAKKNEALAEDFNVASKTRMTIAELANYVCERYSDGKIKPDFGDELQNENYKPVPNTAKVEKLGFKENVSFDEGIELTKKWIENMNNG